MKKKKNWFLNNKNIINKNLPIKPNNGGIPANDSRLNIIKMEIKLNIEKFLNWFKVLNWFKSNIKKILKIRNNKIKYIKMFSNNKLNPYSIDKLKFKKFMFNIFLIHE